MGLSASMWSSVSGLLTQGEKMNVIGNNLANVSTLGFKSQRVDFSDFIYQDGFSTGGTTQIGRGANINAVVTDFSQGSFETTNIATDLAIGGDGYFQVRDQYSDQVWYTRAGNFNFNQEGELTLPTGQMLQGWKIDNSSSPTIGTGANPVISEPSAIQGTGVPTDITLDTWTLPPKQTSKVSFSLNLTSDSGYDKTTSNTNPFFAISSRWDGQQPPKPTTVSPLSADAYAYQSPIKVYDEGGTSHTLTAYFDQVDSSAVEDLPKGYSVYEYILTMDPAEDVRTYGGVYDPDTGTLKDVSPSELIAPTQFSVEDAKAAVGNAGCLALAKDPGNKGFYLSTTENKTYGEVVNGINTENATLKASTYKLDAFSVQKYQSGGWVAEENATLTFTSTTGGPSFSSDDIDTVEAELGAKEKALKTELATYTAGTDDYLDCEERLAAVTTQITDLTAIKDKLDTIRADLDVYAGPVAGDSSSTAELSSSVKVKQEDGSYSVVTSISGMDPSSNVDDKNAVKLFNETEAGGLLMKGTMTFNSAGQIVSQSSYTYLGNTSMGQDEVPQINPNDPEAWQPCPVSNNGYPVFNANFTGQPLANAPYQEASGSFPDARDSYIEFDFGIKATGNLADPWGVGGPYGVYDTNQVSIEDVYADIDANGDVIKPSYEDIVGFKYLQKSATATTNRSGGSVTQDASQDGYSTGNLTNVSVDTDGILSGVYSNGITLPLYQITMFDFVDEQGLRREGGNLYSATMESGNPQVAAANQGGMGSINAYSIEQSNVDMTREFVQMITTQRGFQANSKGITTVDTMLEQVINMKR